MPKSSLRLTDIAGCLRVTRAQACQGGCLTPLLLCACQEALEVLDQHKVIQTSNIFLICHAA